MKLGEIGQYVFEVDRRSNKIQIKKAVEEMFEVNVRSVRTLNVKGKAKNRLTRTGYMKGRTPSFKKAYVTLKEGQKIDVVSSEAL